MIPVTYFPNIAITTPSGTAPIDILFETIRLGGRGGRLKAYIEEIRNYSHNKKVRTSLKRKNLPVITWQGEFNKRANTGVERLSGLMCIDIDHCTENDLLRYKSSLILQPWCVAIFRSPSGDGIKVVVQTDNYDINAYHSCYCQLEEYFSVNYGIKPDKNCEPISQGCFASYDPDIYVNLCASPFHLEYTSCYERPLFNNFGKAETAMVNRICDFTPLQQFQNNLSIITNGMTDEQIIEILDRKFSRYKQNYEDGNRTRSVFAQAVIMCKAGISQINAIEYLSSRFVPTGFLKEKVLWESSNAYTKNRHLFGSERGQYLNYANFLKSRNFTL